MPDVAPSVTVVVTTYNRAELLRETVASILAQTFRDFELLVIDNLSGYDIAAVIASFNDTRIRLIQNANGGVIAVNRNVGIREARGTFVAFCDDDDLWEPQKLERQLAVMTRDERVALVYVTYQWFGVNGMSGPVLPPPDLRVRGPDTFSRLYFATSIANSGVMVRRGVLAAVGPIDEARELVGFEDADLWLRIAQRYAIDFVDEPPLLRYRVGTLNWSNRSAWRRLVAIHRLLRKHRDSAGPFRYWLGTMRYALYFAKQWLVGRLRLTFHGSS